MEGFQQISGNKPLCLFFNFPVRLTVSSARFMLSSKLNI
jgi:hypothetical protein